MTPMFVKFFLFDLERERTRSVGMRNIQENAESDADYSRLAQHGISRHILRIDLGSMLRQRHPADFDLRAVVFVHHQHRKVLSRVPTYKKCHPFLSSSNDDLKGGDMTDADQEIVC